MMRGLNLKIAAIGALAGLSLLSQSNLTLATEIKLATSRAPDTFVTSLQNSSSLEKAGIKITLQRLVNDDEVLDAVVTGSADLGLFALDVLSKRKFDDQPKLYSVFTRPFFFESSDQIFNLEETPLGDAVLADVARVGVLPLAYWNRGLSQIVAKRPLVSVESFRGLTVAGTSENWFKEDAARPVLTSLGAEPVPTSNVAVEFRKESVVAAIWRPLGEENDGMSGAPILKKRL
jgi:TRAP-type C4-dicarboxylate transport system substrate-binding protein